MSDVLGRIDDTLGGWHGSADSMRWKPPRPTLTEADAQRMIAAFQANTEAFKTAWQHIAAEVTKAYAALRPLIEILQQAPPGPKTLDAAYRQRQKNRVKRKNHRR